MSRQDEELDLSMFDSEDVDTSMFADSEVDTSDFEKKDPPKPLSVLESGLRGLAQGATLGFGDEISGGIDWLLSKSGDLFVPEGGKNPYEGMSDAEVYRQGRDEARRANELAKASNPKTYSAAEIAGGGVLPGGTGFTKMAGMGAIDALGQSEAEDPTRLAIDAAMGGALGSVLGSATKALGAREALKKTINKAANKAAEDSAGLTRTLGDRRKLLKELEDQKLEPGEIGQYLRDEKLVTPKDTVETIAHKLGVKREEVGKELQAMVAEGTPVSVTALAQRLRNRIKDYDQSGVSDEIKRRLSKVSKSYDDIASPEVVEVSKILDAKGNPIIKDIKEAVDEVPLSQIREDRSLIGKKVKDFSSDSPTKQADIDIYKELSDVLKENVKDPKAWAAKNREYNLIKHVDDNAITNAAAAQGKQGLRVGNVVPAMLGGKLGGFLGSAGAVAANNVAAQRGALLRMGALEKLEKLLKTPEVIPEPIRNTLMEAAKRGQLPAVHSILSKRVPEYNQWLEQSGEK